METLDDFDHVALSGDASLIEEDCSGSERSREIGIVRDHDFRLRQASEQREKIAPRGRVEERSRFVEH